MFTREKHIYTFESFCQHIRGAFGNSSLIDIVPVIAIMDYKKYYDYFIDEKLVDKFSKVEGTQLYFKFQPLRPKHLPSILLSSAGDNSACLRPFFFVARFLFET